MKTLSRAFVTGASGFVGGCLMEHLRSSGAAVLGHDARLLAGSHFPIHQADIRNQEDLRRVLSDFQPDVIYHLASVLKSDEPQRFFEVNVIGTLSLLEALLASGLRPCIVIASSSAVYGPGRGAKPLTETLPPRPVTQYAVSKLAQELVAFQYVRSAGLPVICVRTFNLLGPGLSPDLAPAAFARQIARAEREGSPAKIFTGDLSARRDFVDVRDAVQAYALIARHGTPGQVYNVCSGRAAAMAEILQILLDQARVPLEAVSDPARLQKNDVPVQVGNARKLQKSTGWKATIPLKKSLVDLLDDFRSNLETA